MPKTSSSTIRKGYLRPDATAELAPKRTFAFSVQSESEDIADTAASDVDDPDLAPLVELQAALHSAAVRAMDAMDAIEDSLKSPASPQSRGHFRWLNVDPASLPKFFELEDAPLKFRKERAQPDEFSARKHGEAKQDVPKTYRKPLR